MQLASFIFGTFYSAPQFKRSSVQEMGLVIRGLVRDVHSIKVPIWPVDRKALDVQTLFTSKVWENERDLIVFMTGVPTAVKSREAIVVIGQVSPRLHDELVSPPGQWKIEPWTFKGNSSQKRYSWMTPICITRSVAISEENTTSFYSEETQKPPKGPLYQQFLELHHENLPCFQYIVREIARGTPEKLNNIAGFGRFVGK